MKKQVLNEDVITRNILDRIRGLQENTTTETERFILTEEVSNDVNAIAITDDIRFGQNALSNQIEQFRSSVESGAQFSEPERGRVAEAPLIYLPKTGNLIFSGTIPCLNNLKWQFVLKTTTGSGCFLWSDGMILSKDNLEILNKLHGYYLNWRNEFNNSARDLEMIGKMFNKD